ncbi:uncharacterized protein TNCV_4931091 [Trichonephila clavipes]|nr:uncharacterized protein TNCV_4931091 [Trichonephila clavipes]
MGHSVSEIDRQLGFSRSTVSRVYPEYMDDGQITSDRANCNGQLALTGRVGGTAGLRVLPEVYFSGSENVDDFLEVIDIHIKLLEIPSDLACAYLKGHLFGTVRDCKDQEPTDFIYDILKIHKKLGLRMSEEALVDHIFIRLEPQVRDYVEVRNLKTKAQLVEVMGKLEDRYSYKEMRVQEIAIM